MKMPNQFDLETQWDLYLGLIRMKEEDMHPIQLQETKRAFFGGIGQLLVLLRDTMGDLEEGQAINHLESMFNQVNDFWMATNKQQN